MFIYALERKHETIALFSKDFCNIYFLTTSDISSNELVLIQVIAHDLCIKEVDFDEYSKYWLNDYHLTIA